MNPSILTALFLTIACLAPAVCLADKSSLHHSHGMHGIHDDGIMVHGEHIKDHLSKDFGINKDPRDMSKSEMEFYEFKAHDYDENSQLDGLEMLKALTHYDFVDVNQLTDEERRTLTPQQVAEKREKIIAEKYASMEKEIDHMFEEHDLDKDGYITYTEYLIARWKSDEDNKH